MKRFGKIALAALALGGTVAATTVPANAARVAVGIGFGVPAYGYYGYPYAYPYYGYYGYPVVYGGYYGPRYYWHGRYWHRPYWHRGWRHRW